MSNSSIRQTAAAPGRLRPSRRVRVTLGVATSVAAALTMSACGFDAQTLQPYTPAEGVNITVAAGADGNPTATSVEVRNLMVLSRTAGTGFLSASLLAQGTDQLTGGSGTVINTDGTRGSQLSVSVTSPLTLQPNTLLVLTDQPAVTVTAAGLNAGQTANLTLTFAKAGSQQVVVPIVDANFAPYNTISPSPAASSAAPTP